MCQPSLNVIIKQGSGLDSAESMVCTKAGREKGEGKMSANKMFHRKNLNKRISFQQIKLMF